MRGGRGGVGWLGAGAVAAPVLAAACLAMGLTAPVPLQGAPLPQGECPDDREPWVWIGVGFFHCQGGSCLLGEAGARAGMGLPRASASEAFMYPEPRERDRRGFDFSVEPRVGTIAGPARGILEPGDVLVAVDGLPITSREGGRRLAHLQPGEPLPLLVRRGDRYLHLSVTPEATCYGLHLSAGPAPEPARGWNRSLDLEAMPTPPAFRWHQTVPSGQWPEPSGQWPEVSWDPLFQGQGLSFELEARPFAFEGRSLEFGARPFDPWGGAFHGEGLSFGVPSGRAPAARIQGAGVTLAGPTRVEVGADGRVSWRFVESPRVAAVVPDSPAGRAGLQAGWVLLQAGGHPVTSVEGTEALAGFGTAAGSGSLVLRVRAGRDERTVVLER